MSLVDIISAVNTVLELVKNVSEMPHMDEMPSMFFLFGVSLNSNKGEKDKNKQK